MAHIARNLRRFPPHSPMSYCRFALCSTLVLLLAPGATHGLAQSPANAAGETLVTVNGKPITRGDLEFQFEIRQIAADQRESAKQAILERLIDDRLMQAFLESRNATATKEAIDAEVARLYESIRLRGGDPQQFLKQAGYSEESLRRELALPLAWRSFAAAAIGPERLREHFEKHRQTFDGTERRASQIFLNAETEEVRAAALKTLTEIRQQILDGKLTFAASARMHSQAPTAAVGGDVGYFPYRGRMPEAFTREAFRLKKGEISEPFATPFGVHLVTVTDVRPGQLSLEDARGEVFDALAAALWKEIIRQEREKAKIEWAKP